MKEIEVKLRVKDIEHFTKLKTLLNPFHSHNLHQQNYFFDTPTNDLFLNRSVLRIRILQNQTPTAILCLKSNPILINGVSRVEEDEEEIDPPLAISCVAEPSRLRDVDSRVLRRCKEEFDEKGVVCLGGFRNLRSVYEWKGFKLEVDETEYEFGTCFEIECENEDPESVKKELEGFLNENGIEYNYSEMTKFAVFRSGKFP